MANSGVEIASLRGDAAAALGSSDSGSAPIVYGNTDASRVNERLDYITALNFQKNKSDYERKLAKSDQLFQMLQSQQMRLKELLPEDRNMIRSKYLAPIEKFLIDDPDAANKPDSYIKLQQKITDFNEAQAYGAHRYQMILQKDKDIAAETDPDKRAAMLADREASARQSLFQVVKPYQQQLDFTADMLVEPPAVDLGTKEDLIGDKLVQVKTTRTPLADFVKGALYNYTSNPKKSMKAKYDLYQQHFNELPDNQKQELIDQWNQSIQAANSNEGLKDGDAYYVKPFVPVMIKGEDGVDHVQLNETPDRLVMAQSIAKNYKNNVVPTEKVSELGLNMAAKRADIAQTEYETKNLLPARVAKLYADIAKGRTEQAKTLEETFKLRQSNKQEDAGTNYIISQTLHMLEPESYQGAKKAEASPRSQSKETAFMTRGVSAIPIESQSIGKWLKDAKLTKGVQKYLTDNYQMGQTLSKQQILDAVAANNPAKGIVLAEEKNGTQEAYSFLSPQEMGALKLTKDGKELLPKRVILNTDNPDKPELIGYYYPITKVGHLEQEATDPIIQRIEPQDLIPAVIKSTVGDNPSGDESKSFENTAQSLRRKGGSNDLNKALAKLRADGFLQKQLTGQDANTIPSTNAVQLDVKRKTKLAELQNKYNPK